MPTSSTQADADHRVTGVRPLPAGGPDGCVALWWLDLTAPADLSVLDATERARCAELPSVVARRRLATSRAMVRAQLALLVGTEAAEIELDRTCRCCGAQHGPLRLSRQGGRPLQVSVSRSGDRALLAVSRAGPVGIDLERRRIVASAARRARQVLTPAAAAAVERAAAAEASSCLLRQWVRHEAVIKASAAGLREGLPRFAVSDAADPARRVVDRAHGCGAAPGWWVDDVVVEPGWVAALAVSTGSLTRYSPAT